jgi:hypothetical protein
MLQAPEPDGGIVGRDDLCEVLQDEFERHEEADGRDSYGGVNILHPRRAGMRGSPERNRRPVVLVGGVGAGKTAVLIQLTKLLADRGVLPIPIRLRDAQSALDFLELARQAFFKEAGLIPGTEGDRIWRRLLNDDRIVIVADGLEEALTGVVESRETAIQVAMENIRDADVPLVVASRPHDVLHYLDARLLRLEPLARADALEYIRREDPSGGTETSNRLQGIVETAEVVEMPLYMEIARQLHRKQLLESVDMRHVGREVLRVRLLERWIEATIAGKIEPLVAINPTRRREVVNELEALACVGLFNDDLDVNFVDVSSVATQMASSGAPSVRNADPHYGDESHGVADLLDADAVKLRAVAADGARLRLVDPLADGVRFRHSTVQAYLGAQRIDKFFEGDGSERLRQALRSPGRELLMALEMKCVVDPSVRPRVSDLLREAVYGSRIRTFSDSKRPFKSWHGAKIRVGSRILDLTFGGPQRQETQTRLSARRRGKGVDRPMKGWKAIATAASAVSVHSLIGDGADAAGPNGSTRKRKWEDLEGHIDHVIDTAWRHAGEQTYATDEAKIRAIARIAEAHRYDALWRICCAEQRYRVRLYAVRKLGGGGLPAVEAVRHRLSKIAQVAGSDTTQLPNRESAVTALRAAGVLHADERERQPDRVYALQGLLLPQLLQSVAAEQPATTRAHLKRDEAHLEADKRAAAAGSTAVATMLGKAAAQVRAAAVEAPEAGEGAHGTAAETMHNLLGDWVRAAGSGKLYRTSEIALAHGFKHAANYRPERTSGEARHYLFREAEWLLDRTSFWFTQMALIQALTLLLLADLEPTSSAKQDACRKIDHWLEHAKHPFVLAAGGLCKEAVEDGKPARHIWMEEVDVVSKLGPSAAFVEGIDDQRQLDSKRWIPRAAGWFTLVPRGQQLVADVVVLLNLADRGGTTQDREDGLESAAQEHLPPCLVRPGGRDHLRVDRPLDDSAGGRGSRCHSDCDMHLCPYPALDEELSREELGESFCRRQQALLSRRVSRSRPEWQQAQNPAELRKFWAAMAHRRRL